MYDLDFTTLYSQPSEHYERVLHHKKRNKKRKQKKTTIEEVFIFKAILKSERRITLPEIIFFNNTCWFQNIKFSVLF